MPVYEIDPLTDERWDKFLQGQTQASVFHTRAWMEALRKTYDYRPVLLTTSPPGTPLANGIPFCRVAGLFGKARLVSLPFSDHCSPLVADQGQLTRLLQYLLQQTEERAWKYVQIRGSETSSAEPFTCEEGTELVLHKLDLRPPLETIFSSFHASCVRRKIKRAQREGLIYKDGASEMLLNIFYQLHVATRRRLGMPSQPLAWFRNLANCLGDQLKLQVAYKGITPVAGIVVLRYRKSAVYKYGCSDHRFSSLGGMQSLLWNAMRAAKEDGCVEFDMGRSDFRNLGLVTFKDRWGATRTRLRYLRYPYRRIDPVLEALWGKIMKGVWSQGPAGLVSAAGRALYKYAG